MSDETARLLIVSLCGVITTLVGFIARELVAIRKDVHELKLDAVAVKSHLGIKTSGGIAIKLKTSNANNSDYVNARAEKLE